ncbi:MAG: hypothetical protein QNK36_06735 [Colwellia sp.]|nr:hypothetical protein [Colwellia sp.]
MKLLSSLSLFKASCFSLMLYSFFAKAGFVDTAQNWQTFETDNFRVHYTPQYKQWALSSAREMEQVRTLIKKQQGRVLDEKIDSYIIDPFNAANGFAIPLSNAPYMTLFTTPPQSDSVIANSTGWQQLLVLHEYVHLVHLGQKNRADWRNNIANWYDIYDASQIIGHRWVSEGYATLLESKLTGRGRLYNNAVEAIIQQFSREGALPNYTQLSKINDDYLSGSMAYLVGVRYLKWLEENYGEDTLDAVWTRWRAVKKRDFEEAFKGVFQDSAKHLYQRFVAEYTFNALTKEQNYTENTSALWLDLNGAVSAPSLSPNGKYLAIVDSSQKQNNTRKITLAVYNTEDNIKKQQEFKDNVDAILKADPQDIANKAPKVFKREQKFTLNQQNYNGINNPRWLDNDTIIYGATTVDSKNSRHQDLFSWHIPSNAIKQITTNANVRRFDIANIESSSPFIIAERSRYGSSQLVKLTINGKFEQALTPASVESVYDFVRIKPQQKNNNETNKITFAYLQTTLNEKWRLKISTLDTSNSAIISEQVVPLPKNYQFLSFPEWSKEGESIFYVAGVKDEIKLYQYNLTEQELTALTSGQHPVSWPVVIDKNKLLHLAINSQGPDVYQLQFNNSKRETITNTTQSGVVTSLLASKFTIDKAQMTIDKTIGHITPYGLGPQQGTLTLGTSYNSASSSIVELGYKSSDALQRFDWQVNISQDVFYNVLSGLGGNIRWQGWPVKLGAHAYQFDLKTQQQASDALALGQFKEQGIHLEATYPYRYNTLTFNFVGQIKVAEIDDISNTYTAIGFNQTWLHEQQVWGLNQQTTMHYLSGKIKETNNNNQYNGSDGSLTIIGHFNEYYLGFDYTWAKRSKGAGDILSLGGFNSTLVQPKAHLNKQLTPELAFYRQRGNHYEKLSAFIPLKGVKLSYTRHKMSEQVIIDSYGLQGKITNNFGFTGINNIAIDFGLAQVNPQNAKSETQAWLGFWHKW